MTRMSGFLQSTSTEKNVQPLNFSPHGAVGLNSGSQAQYGMGANKGGTKIHAVNAKIFAAGDEPRKGARADDSAHVPVEKKQRWVTYIYGASHLCTI